MRVQKIKKLTNLIGIILITVFSVSLIVYAEDIEENMSGDYYEFEKNSKPELFTEQFLS